MYNLLHLLPRQPKRVGGIVVGLCLAAALTGSAHAARVDSDKDGMPNRWEVKHGLSQYVANATGDPDKDGLKNIAEYRNGADPKDEDTENDGADDGDEVKLFDSEPNDRDSDDDGARDGDEDGDSDGIANEDEDDFIEPCRADDDDSDSDGIDNEDENESGTRVRDADSNDDGVADGNEDLDANGIDEEDEDDDADDRCEAEEDGEDLDDLIAHVTSYNPETGELVAELLEGGIVTGAVTAETRFEWERIHGQEADSEPTPADLVTGSGLSEIEFDSDTGTLEKLKLLP